jgi:hypothetical protein
VETCAQGHAETDDVLLTDIFGKRKYGQKLYGTNQK